MPRVLRFQLINGDGSSAAEQTFAFYPDTDAAGEPYRDEAGQPWIALELKPVTKEQYREFVKARTTYVPGPGGMGERVDRDAVEDDVVAAAVLSWRGFVGADDQPLVCREQTKRALDGALKRAIVNRAMFAQPAEVPAASFREPAGVSGVVG